jgi:hypothetical protein
MRSRTEQIIARLRDLRVSTPDIEASAVVSVDGLIMASDLPAEVEEDRVSAMSAAMLSLGERIAGELGRGALDQVYIRGDNGYVILMSVGEGRVDRSGSKGCQIGAGLSGYAPGCWRPGPSGVGEKAGGQRGRAFVHGSAQHARVIGQNSPFQNRWLLGESSSWRLSFHL